jgi:DNA-binding MarR family transcriptional regulator
MSAIQQSLNFETPPRSRRTDPKSSSRAESELRKSGALRGQATVVFDALLKRPGRSSKELAREAGLDRYMVARRVSDLWRGGYALKVEIGKRDCLWYAIV